MAMYVAIVTVISGLRREAQEVIAGYESDIIVQARGAANPMSSRILPHELRWLQKRFGGEVVPFTAGTLRETWSAYALVIGTTARMMTRFGLEEGRPPRAGEREAVIGSLLARRLGATLGSSLPLGGTSWKIVGTYRIGNRYLDGAVVVQVDDGQRLFGLDQGVNVALVRANGTADAHHRAREIGAAIPRLVALTSDDFLRTLRIFKTIESFVNAMAIIAFLGSVMVVTNTLLMAVSERTRDIGILMAVGWSPVRIVRMLFAEGLTLCLLGALLGNGLALLLLRFINDSRVVGFGWVPIALPLRSTLASLGLTAAVAVIASVWPAAVVARLSPARALYSE
jgi:putative ABC transport system permease protein